jgi:hypothetical protein
MSNRVSEQIPHDTSGWLYTQGALKWVCILLDTSTYTTCRPSFGAGQRAWCTCDAPSLLLPVSEIKASCSNYNTEHCTYLGCVVNTELGMQLNLLEVQAPFLEWLLAHIFQLLEQAASLQEHSTTQHGTAPRSKNCRDMKPAAPISWCCTAQVLTVVTLHTWRGSSHRRYGC